MESLHGNSANYTDPYAPTASRPTKRARKDVDISTLSDEHRVILLQAAAILEVPVNQVPDRVRRLQIPPIFGGETRRRSQYQANRTMGGGPDNHREAVSMRGLPPPEHDSGSPPVEGGLRADMTSTPIPYAMESGFGFEIGQNKWSECLPGFASSEEAGQDNELFSNPSEAPPAAGVSRFPAHFACLPNGAIIEPATQLPNMAEKFPSYGSSASDLLLGSPPIARIPALKPMQVQRMQPTSNENDMTYSRINNSPGSTVWNRDTSIGIGMGDNHGYCLGPNQLEESGMYSDHYQQWSEEGQDSDCISTGERAGNVRRGPFRSQQEREETAQTRKLAACVRCRMQRIRCVPDPSNLHGECLTCKSVSKLKLSKLPCLRYKITDVKLFKPGQVPGMEWTRRWTSALFDDISTWSSGGFKTIQVTEGYGPNPLTLKVREFVPLPGDMLQRHWFANGIKKSAILPHYAIVDLAVAEKAYWDYISQAGTKFFKNALNYKDKLLWATYDTAIETANNPEMPESDRNLLKMVLQLWVAIRITSRSIRISGRETLGMTRDILDETSPLHGSIPIPPVMGAQIELILIQKILAPLRLQVLDMLQSVIKANKASSWFTVYLCIFILLHNCAMITKHDAGYARKHGIQARFARPGMVEEYHYGANILLAYFHYCSKGSLPFAMSSRTVELTMMGGLNQKQVSLVENTKKYVKAHKIRFEDLRWQKLVEHDHYFVAQLYEDGWRPRPT